MEDKTSRLLRELDAIEKKSQAMRRETERLRRMKNEAKQALALRYPDLFANKADGGDGNYDNSILSTTISVATQSDDSLGLDDIGVGMNKPPQMSRELQDVYDTLMKFQKRDSSSFSLDAPAIMRRKVVSKEESLAEDDRLSDILAAYGIKQKTDSAQIELRNCEAVKKADDAAGNYFIPVDYETYSKWMLEKQKVTTAPPQPPEAESKVIQPPPKEEDGMILEDLNQDPGDDTSQDAADLLTQESKESKEERLLSDRDQPPIEANVKVIGHPDRSDNKAEGMSAKSSIDKPLPIVAIGNEEEVDMVERDVNFLIESDNVDEKLYSSESESMPKKTNELKKVVALSSSSSSDHRLVPKKMNNPAPPKVVTLQIHSDSESKDEVINADDAPKHADDDLSGPEVEDVDDFWN